MSERQEPSKQGGTVANKTVRKPTLLERKFGPQRRRQAPSQAIAVVDPGVQKPPDIAAEKVSEPLKPEQTSKKAAVAGQGTRKRSTPQGGKGHSTKKPGVSQLPPSDDIKNLQRAMHKKRRALAEYRRKSQRLRRVQQEVDKFQAFCTNMVAETSDSHEQALYQKLMRLTKLSAEKVLGQETKRIEKEQKQVRKEADSLRQAKMRLE
ncbi:hypothetical protein AK830_g546 [Neonectria ditissima]|uniref:Uncharacterized protein n=1 Tax=Neonectria ditissima TaxID=78410 RepID=A0A0P7BGV5_9HYPO|nr:hypothetical protein AK830_g546 [Neonectria ditissima]